MEIAIDDIVDWKLIPANETVDQLTEQLDDVLGTLSESMSIGRELSTRDRAELIDLLNNSLIGAQRLLQFVQQQGNPKTTKTAATILTKVYEADAQLKEDQIKNCSAALAKAVELLEEIDFP